MTRSACRHWNAAFCLAFLFCGCQKPAATSVQGAATPEELIARLVEAIKSDDPEAMAVITAAPGDEVIRSKARRVRDMQAASLALEKQCDNTFGPRAQSTPVYGSVLAQRVMDGAFPGQYLKRKSEVTAKLVKQEALPDGTFKLTVEQSETWDGQTRSGPDSLTAVKTAEGWKIAIPQGLLDLPGNSRDAAQRLLELFRLVSREVQDGQFRHRDEVDFLMARELINYMPSVLVEAEVDSALRDDAARLDLGTPPDNDGLPVPDIRVEVSPDTDKAKVLLRFDVQSQDSSPALLPQQIGDLQKHLMLPDGFPIKVVVRQGVQPAAIVPVLHAMLDVHATSPRPVISLVVEYSEDWNALAPQLTGRLRLYTIAAPKTNDPLRLNTEDFVEQPTKLTDIVDDLESILKRDSESPLDIQAAPSGDDSINVSEPGDQPSLLDLQTADPGALGDTKGEGIGIGSEPPTPAGKN